MVQFTSKISGFWCKIRSSDVKFGSLGGEAAARFSSSSFFVHKRSLFMQNKSIFIFKSSHRSAEDVSLTRVLFGWTFSHSDVPKKRKKKDAAETHEDQKSTESEKVAWSRLVGQMMNVVKYDYESRWATIGWKETR